MYKLFPWGSWFFRYWKVYDARSTDFEKSDFFPFFEKKSLFSTKKLYFLFSNSKVYILISQTKKIQTILMNFTGIFAKRRKGQTKSEKNKAKKEQFSYTHFK